MDNVANTKVNSYTQSWVSSIPWTQSSSIFRCILSN